MFLGEEVCPKSMSKLKKGEGKEHPQLSHRFNKQKAFLLPFSQRGEN